MGSVIVAFLIHSSIIYDTKSTPLILCVSLAFFFSPLAYFWIQATLAQISEDFSRLFASDHVDHTCHISAFITGVLLRFASQKQPHINVRKQRFLQTSKFVSAFILTAFFLTTFFFLIRHK